MVTWPASLPQRVLKSNFSAAPENTSVESKPEMGPSQSRPRFTASEDPFSVAYRLSHAQWQTLRQFYKNDTAFGSIAFDYPDPLTGNTISVKFAKAPEIQGTATPDKVTVAVELKEQP